MFSYYALKQCRRNLKCGELQCFTKKECHLGIRSNYHKQFHLVGSNLKYNRWQTDHHGQRSPKKWKLFYC